LSCAVAAASAAPPTGSILMGYRFGFIPGVKTSEIAAKLGHRPGDHITDADVAADEKTVERELRSRKIEGRLFASTAEKNGHVWILFDLVQEPVRVLESQTFVGAVHVSPKDLAKVSGLSPGAHISIERLNAARKAILAAYGKAMQGKHANVKLRIQTSIPSGLRSVRNIRLTWIIDESKSPR